MEILYLYFFPDKFQSLKLAKQNINFGGSHRFHYDTDSKHLLVSLNPFFIPDFFKIPVDDESDFAKIVNVTSIIGENGTGKSSLLRLIKNNFAEGQGGIKTPLMVAIKRGNSLIFYHSEEIVIGKHNLNDFGISLQTLAVEKIIHKKISGQDVFYEKYPSVDSLDTHFISFSNIFDGEIEIEVEGCSDISTNFLIRNDFTKSVEEQYINHEVDQRQIDIHLFGEIERQIAFINRYAHNKLIPFELPEYINISSKREVNYEFGYSKNEKKILFDYGIGDDFLSLMQKVEGIIKDANRRDKIISHFIATCLLNFFLELATHYRAIDEIGSFKLDFTLVRNSTTVQEVALALLDDLKQQSRRKEILFGPEHEKWIDGVIKFIEELPKLKIKVEWLSDNYLLPLRIIGDSKDSFRHFYETYRNSFRLKPYLNFKWRSLSSGEKALFNIYSRFYALSNEEVINELQENLIVLIDEGDVYLHPAWQKKFIYLLLEYLPAVYSKMRNGINRKIQVIITTNSPIPASDLPNDNTIFLEKKSSYDHDMGYISSTIVKDSLNDQKETFAANIYTLLSDSFFIKSGVIGDFASEKLNRIIKELTSGYEIIAKRRDEIRKIIQQVGEPVLRHKLFQLYYDRFNLNIHERLDRIESQLGL